MFDWSWSSGIAATYWCANICHIGTVKIKNRGIKKVYQYNFNPDMCWYKDVCQNICNDSCIRYMEMDYLLYHSQIPKKQQFPISLRPEAKDFHNFVFLAGIKDDITDFVNAGDNIYITSEYTGNGKTSWAIKMMLKFFDRIWSGNGFRVRGIFIHVPTFLSKLKSNIKNPDIEFESLVNCLADIDLVVWDDIASTGLSQYDHSQLLTYIDQRVLSGKSNIFTGNIPNKENLSKAVGTRLASRILCGQVVELKGRDRRLNGSITSAE